VVIHLGKIMALKPVDDVHALQILAGQKGRAAGHDFEFQIAEKINNLSAPYDFDFEFETNVQKGNPEILLLAYILRKKKIPAIKKVTAISTGALATSEEGKKWLLVNGVKVTRCKSDLIISIQDVFDKQHTFGISTKQCNNRSPTNAQLYFTTAKGFVNLLNNNGFSISSTALNALQQFCGDQGFRPLDYPNILANRKTDPRRFFWEEIDPIGRAEWVSLFNQKQNEISKLLLQKAYMNDPFIPEFLLHKTKKSDYWEQTEVALYEIDELVILSEKYQSFVVKKYSVKKGSYRDPSGVEHDAPRFGIIQMQRGGQQQHPDQLQFNLEAGYFYKI
jgi:hypothetical protein